MLVTFALAPIIVPQARATRRRALKMEEPLGPREGTGGHGPTMRLLVIGDSSAAGVGVARQDEALSGQVLRHLAPHRRVHWTLLARSGATTADLLSWLPSVDGPFDSVLLAIGVNDVTRGATLPRWLVRQRALLRGLRGLGARRIVVSGFPPVHRFPLLPQPTRWVVGGRARRFDRARMRLVARTEGAVNLPFEGDLGTELMAEDGFHPGPEVYARWGGLAAQALLAG